MGPEKTTLLTTEEEILTQKTDEKMPNKRFGFRIVHGLLSGSTKAVNLMNTKNISLFTAEDEKVRTDIDDAIR